MRARVSRLAWLPPLFAFAVFVFEARRYSGKSLYFVDDPFISMRFAANLLTRGELSFNPGDKIEGYSNLLHVLVHAAVFKLQGGVPDAARAIDGAALVVFGATLLEALLLGVLALRGRLQGADATAWYCAWVLTMASWPFAFWASAGMETPIEGLFYVAILLATTALPGRGAAASGAPLAILGGLLVGVTLLRFEGVIVAVTIALAISVYLVRSRQTRSALFLTVPIVVAAAAYHLWRIAYFGTLLPNTFVAKATGGSTLARLQAGASYSGGWTAFLGGGLGLAAVALAVARTWRLGREALARFVEDPVRCVAGALVLVKVALVVWGGGDWMPGWRMLLPVTPIALFLVFRSLLASVEDGPSLLTSRSGAIALALLVVVCGRGNAEFSPPHGSTPDEAGSGKKIPQELRRSGAFPRAHHGRQHRGGRHRRSRARPVRGARRPLHGPVWPRRPRHGAAAGVDAQPRPRRACARARAGRGDVRPSATSATVRPVSVRAGAARERRISCRVSPRGRRSRPRGVRVGALLAARSGPAAHNLTWARHDPRAPDPAAAQAR